MKRTMLAFGILFGLFAAGCDEPASGSAAPSGSGTAVALSDADLRKIKTGLSKKVLEHYRELLLQKRA